MICIDYVIGFGLHSQKGQEASLILPDFSLVPANILEVGEPRPSQILDFGPGWW